MPRRTIVPPDLFGGSAPRLSHLQLSRCDINWTSPLFKNLQFLELHSLSLDARPSPAEWLDAMDQMMKLEVLIAYFATPMVPLVGTTLPEPTHVVTHQSLTRLHLSAIASDCAFALAHLILPKLKSVRVDIFAELSSEHDVRTLIPYISRNAHGPQDVKPLQSMIVSGGISLTEIILWTESNADIEVRTPMSLLSAAQSARAIFTISSDNLRVGTRVEILDAILATLPLSSLGSLTAQNSDFSEALWLDHAPRWPLLEDLRLVDNRATMSFIEVLTRDTPPDGPLFPSLAKLSLINSLPNDGAHHLLRDMLIGRVEQGVPLQALDLRSYAVTTDVVQLLNDIVADVQRPKLELLIRYPWPTLSNWSTDMAIFIHEHVYGDEDEDLEVSSDGSMVNPWFLGYTDDEGGDEDEVDLDLV